MPIRSVSLIAAAVVVVAGCSVHVSSAPASSTMSDHDVFAAGSRGLAFAHITSAQETWGSEARTAAGDTVASTGAVQRMEARFTAHEGAPAILLIKSSGTRAATTFGDTVLMLRDGFRPIWERMHFRNNSKIIQYSGDRVHAQIFVGDSLTKTLDKTYPHAPFGFNQLELLLRSLPFRPGYRTLLPLFSEGDDSVETDSVSVLALTSGPKPLWTIRFADPAIILTCVVDTMTRQFIRFNGLSRQSGMTSSRIRVEP